MDDVVKGAATGRRRSLGPWAVALLAVGSLAAACGGSGGGSPAAPATTTTAATAATTTTLPATTTTTALAANVPAGFTGFTDAADRFTIAAPAGWRQVDPKSPGANQATQSLASSNPKLAAVLPPGDLVSLGVKFLAASTTGSTANVVVRPAVGVQDSDLTQLGEELRSQYKAIGAVPTALETIQLSGRTALRVKLDLRMTRPTGGKATVHEVQYALVANDLLYLLTLAGDSPQLGGIPDTLRIS
jgi:hypothetical protein